MKKLNKKVTLHIGLLALIYLVIILFITKFKFIYGSDLDFIKQHVVFPDYFRNLFYETRKLIPEFALHLGGGQNIFYFAYYGLLSPFVLFSYLFPFIEMTTYLIISNILIVFVSIILFYYFLRKNDFNYSICFISSLLFLFSNSFIFHSHRHLMFVNYMPFLIFALIGVIRYFDSHKSGLLIINIFLMILTSFYFSIPGILAVCLYGLYYYLKINQNSSIKKTVIAALKFIIRIILGILLAGFFLLPIAYIILNGRSSTGIQFNISLFIPKVNLGYLMYGTYGIGSTAILWIASIYNLLFLKKEKRILSICLFIITLIPFINLLLNGGLYTNGKCFIPFFPLYILLISNMIKSIETNKIRIILLIIGLFAGLIFINNELSYLIFFSIEILITLLCMSLFNKKKKYIFFAPILIIAFLICIITNSIDELVTINEYKSIQEVNDYNYEKYMNKDSIYRFIDDKNDSYSINYSKAANDYRITSYSSTTNPYYTDVFYNTFNNNDIYRNKFMLNETNNLFFQRFMGVKYLLTDSDAPYGYKMVKMYKNATLYETDNVLPIGYASSNLLNVDEYKKMALNEQLEAFNNNIIINGKTNNANLNTLSKKIKLDYIIESSKDVSIKFDDNHYLINTKKNGILNLKLNNPIMDNSLIIRFKMNHIPSCKKGDVIITINDIENKLTCKSWKYYNNNETFDYVISSDKEINQLNIKFSKGTYDISNIEIYTIPNTFFEVNKETISVLKINEVMSKDNVIQGNINVKENGYFLFTIPYDEGFRIFVDDKEIKYELVNDAFIGFKINEGEHRIILKFNAPLLTYGKFISFISLIGIILLILIEKHKKNHN